ncbi:NAD(P)-binding protein [Lentinus brumalis]|uniref:NAD(P)-binding protein n=1 Tax=Lentinus brumalis TaxID=2498619 RepID=A0A371CS93_9APHY|nr:NAD(P)-binding protein [Polyporus brumalis]
MPSYAVIGASRGIGLEFVRQLAARPDTVVFAVVRNASKSTYLQAVAKDAKNIHKAAERVSEVTGGKLDYLIHNAARVEAETLSKGFDDYPSIDELDADFTTSFKVNGLGVIHSIAAFLPLLRAGPTKKIVVISTAGADPKTVRASGFAGGPGYAVSKAAGLLATIKWALKLQDEGFVVVAVNPGLVDSSGTSGEYSACQPLPTFFKKTGVRLEPETPEQSVAAQLKLIDGLKPSDNGLFLEHTGGEYGL